MTGKRTALIAGGVAAGAIAAGAVGRTVLRRRTEHELEAPLWDLPPDDLGPVRSFDGTQLAVRAAGDPSAPLLLFVHGFSLDMTTWREQWVDLSADHRCVLMDLRGHGTSEQPADGDLSVRSMGRDIAAVLEAVAPDRRVVIVGHSMGAIATLAMAEVRPDLMATSVAGVVLVGTSASELVRGAMGSITDIIRPRLGSLRSAAERVDRLRKAVLASPTDLRGAVVRLTQFGPDAPRHVVEHVVHLAERASSEVWTDGLAGLARDRSPARLAAYPHARARGGGGARSRDAPLERRRARRRAPRRPVRGARRRGPHRDDGATGRARSGDPCVRPSRARRWSRPAASAATSLEGAWRPMTRSLAEAAAEAAGCTRCRLAEGRTQVVFGAGDPDADLMFIGEGPGFHEDKQGEPFVGAAGQLLNRVLGEIGLTREQVYIGNIVKCRPPGNRDPRPDEIEACTPWLVEQVSLIQPRVVVTLGNFATKFVLNTETGITRLRGQVHDWHGRTVIPTFHPAAILHGGGEKSRQFQLLLEDFRLVRSTLDSAAVPDPDRTVAAVDATAPPPGVIALPDSETRAVDDDQLELF